MSSLWPTGIRPLHAPLDAALPGGWRATTAAERLRSTPKSERLELPPHLDARFQATPWGDWAHATQSIANERVAALLTTREELDLSLVLQENETFSPSDPRFTLNGSVVKRRGALRRKVLDDVPAELQFQRFLPLLELSVLGSTEPSVDLRSQLTDDVPVLGWVDALGADRIPNDRQFVVRLRGDSMDGGKRPLADGAWLIMELAEAVDDGTVTAVQLDHVGSYTVVLKRFVTENDHVRLVSQNPDVADRVFYADAADSLRVVARFVEELPPPQRMRASNPDKLKDWLRKRLLSPQPLSAHPDLPPQLDGTSYLELSEKGLTWVLGVEPLPPFIDEVVVVGQPVSAEFIRGRVARLPVQPSPAAFTLEAGPLTRLLQPYEHPGLDEGRATIFRRDSAGRALRKLGPHVRVGERVRLLLPPELKAPVGAKHWAVGAWTACELEVTDELPPELGLRVSAEGLETHWSTCPLRWRRAPDGQRIPVFSPTQDPALSVSGVVATRLGELTLTTVDGARPMPPGAEWTVALSGLNPGAHALEVTPADTDIGFVRLAFKVSDEPPPWVSQAIEVTPQGAADLSDWPVEVRAPALWPVDVHWRGSRVVTRSLSVDASGSLPLEAMKVETSLLRQAPLGVLTFDFGELGERSVVHKRKERVADLEAAVAKFVAHARGGHTALIEKLAERLLAALGWSVSAAVAHRPVLTATHLEHEPVAVLVVGDELDQALRDRATEACGHQGLALAFVVARDRWLYFAPGAMFPRDPVALSEAPGSFIQQFHWSTR